MQDRKNVYKIDTLVGGNSAEPFLRSVVEQLREHDAEAKAIGENGAKLVRDLLHPDNLCDMTFHAVPCSMRIMTGHDLLGPSCYVCQLVM